MGIEKLRNEKEFKHRELRNFSSTRYTIKTTGKTSGTKNCNTGK
mgnify:CR=1 FL=1